MAANLNKIAKTSADKIRDSSNESKSRSGISKHSKMRSKGSLAHRPNDRPPYMAWAEQENKRETHFPQRAEYLAADVEQRLESIQAEKLQKLKKFQQDVKERVKALEKVKQLRQLDKSYEAVTAEQKIVYQSSFPRVPTRKKDTCVYREDKYDSLQVGIPGSCKHGYSVVNDPEEVNIASELLDKQVTKIQTCTRHARKVLGSQILNIDTDHLTQLPGGVWNGVVAVTPSEASNEAPQHVPTKHRSCKLTATSLGCREITSTLQEGCKEITNGVNDLSTHEQTSNDKPRCLTGATVAGLNEPRQENAVQPEILEPIQYKVTEDLMRPGRLKEQSKKQEQKQLAVYRRLFMDIEREQVRENLRMKEHRKRMTKLKNKQETKRKEVEYEYDEIIEERSEVVRQKTLLEEKFDEHDDHNQIIRENKRIQKEKELERYVDALRAAVKEKLMKRKLQVPALCSCAPTILNTNPESCANNCIFYKNYKGYVKALSSILSTSTLDL
ncbi:uncharacterized protein LOC114524550 [Dendronephthya gigantea]|uniref:uncharacterized protein LOC114524550 n=1 Tax=Dendronephthya gigantea TaxID=151771 RepID=UPI00106BAEF7|nr:uncharacterized protein LOC114524550 [Dendronephthya gigantea]